MTSPAARGLGLDELESSEALGVARTILAGFDAPDEAQAEVRDRILGFTLEHPDAALRSCVLGHLTASALVVDATGEHALLTHHKKLERWLQLGGHCDGETNLVRAALIEAVEESGIADLVIDPRVLDVDIHAIPARPAKEGRAAEPEHLHLDTRFVVWAPAGAREVVSEESLALEWVQLDGLAQLDTDDSVRRLGWRFRARG